MLRVRGKLKTEPAVGTAIVHGHCLCPDSSSSHCTAPCAPLWEGRPTPAWGESEDRWDYQNWGGLQHNDLAEHPESSRPPCQGPGWCAGHSPKGAGHHCTGACRVYGVKGLYLYSKLGNKTSGYISLNIVCFFIEENHRNRCL